jgi:hypothetical protein
MLDLFAAKGLFRDRLGLPLLLISTDSSLRLTRTRGPSVCVGLRGAVMSSQPKSVRRVRAVALTGAVLTALVLAVPLTASGQAARSAVRAAVASPELVDRAVAAGINYSATPSWDVCVADWNNDGRQDFHAILHFGRSGALYAQSLAGGFTKLPANLVSPNLTPGFGTKAWVDRHACVWADFDGNGLLDLYSTAGRWQSNHYKDEGINNELYLQTAPGVFKDSATQAGVGEPCTRGRYAAVADFNGDGRPDMFYGAQKERAVADAACDNQPTHPYNEQSKIYLNRGKDANGTWLGFRTAPEYDVSLPSVGSRGAVAWDYNKDGKVDLLGLFFPQQKPVLYRNNGTSFTEVVRSGIVRLPAMTGATLGDLNRDGIQDLVYADINGFAYLRGTATGLNTTPVRIGAGIPSNGDGYMVATGDINGDGLTDVYGQITTATDTGNPDDIVYVARADGTFAAYTAPSAGGDANDVGAVTVNGRAQFVVLNGGDGEKDAPGPVQLIAWNGR